MSVIKTRREASVLILTVGKHIICTPLFYTMIYGAKVYHSEETAE